MNHLNEDNLVRFNFNLMDADEIKAAKQHLDDCGQCQQALDALKTKFAAMDTLDADEVPADELIAQTLTHSLQKPGTEVTGRDTVDNTKHKIPLYHRRWVQYGSFAAAAAIVCFLMLQNLYFPPEKESVSKPLEPFAKLDTPQTPETPFPDDRMAALDNGTRASSPRSLQRRQDAYVPLKAKDVRVVSAEEIPDVPPFAPASAIELVVLPKPDKTQVTIYNSKDLTLVRDTRKLTLKPGWNWIQFMWANTQIDPTSLSLTPLKYADKVDIDLISYPARLKDIGRWLIRSEVEGAVPFEITYFASGLSWRAFYMGTMNEDETTMDLKGYVNVSNHSGQDFENTQTRLIVGETRLTEEIRFLAERRYPYGPDITIVDTEDGFARYNWRGKKENEKIPLLGDMPIMGGLLKETDGDILLGAGVADFEVKSIEKTGLSEYFLYTIEGTENLANQWTKRLPSFDVTDIPIKSLYKYDDDRYGKQPVRFVSFANDTEHELGETPIPEGNIKICRNVNEQKNLSYVGQSSIKYIPVNEDIELNLGPARLVKVEPVLIEQQTENYTFDNKGNINGWDDIETYQVTITNTRDIPIDIEITWNMVTDAWELDLHDYEGNSKSEALSPKQIQNPNDPILKTNVEYKKHDKNRARFTMTVAPKTEKVFKHTVRKYRQKRVEAYTQKIQEQEK